MENRIIISDNDNESRVFLLFILQKKKKRCVGKSIETIPFEDFLNKSGNRVSGSRYLSTTDKVISFKQFISLPVKLSGGNDLLVSIFIWHFIHAHLRIVFSFFVGFVPSFKSRWEFIPFYGYAHQSKLFERTRHRCHSIINY